MSNFGGRITSGNNAALIPITPMGWAIWSVIVLATILFIYYYTRNMNGEGK